MKHRLTIGIDEVGRGALAGPVVLAAMLQRRRMRWIHSKLGRIRDSKHLTPARREVWFRHLANHPAVEWRIARVGPGVIDRINIARAANLGAIRAYRRIASTNNESHKNKRINELRNVKAGGSPKRNSLIRIFARNSLFVDEPRYFAFLDGGLKLPATIPHRTIIKGDERLPIIAAASIVAKVWRDRLMRRLAAGFPHYGFEFHKGYGTKHHKRMLRRHGPSLIHRRTFLTKLW